MRHRYITLKSEREIELMRKAGRLARRILDEIGTLARPGVPTHEIDQQAVKLCREAGAIPSFLGKANPQAGKSAFPGAICASVNEAVVHGVPNRTPLVAGDLLSIDFGCQLQGWQGDTAWTYAIGEVSAETRRLMRVTEESLYEGIKQARAGGHVGDIGQAVQRYVERHGYSVIRDLAGHGIGREVWEPPQVPNYGEAHQGARLRVGMTIAIEPMVAMGGYEVNWLEDDWTVVTADGSLAAHYEHTIAILSDGPEILTPSER